MLKTAVVSPVCERRLWPRTACFHRRGFTLVELLVVIAIIGTLIALLLPAIQAARESGRRASCANNIKQLALGVESHKTLLGHFPTGGWNENWLGDKDRGADWRQPGGWCFTILPYIDAKNLYDSGSMVASTNMPLFVCPTRRGTGLVPAGVIGPTGIAAGPWLHTDYAGNRGSYASNLPVADILRETTFGPIGYTPPTSYPSTTDLPAVQTGLQAAAVTLNTPQVPPLSGAAVATGGVIFAGSSVLPVSIRDGTSNTYLIAEKYVPRSSYGVGTPAGQGDAQCAYVGDSADTLRGGQALPQSDATPSTPVLSTPVLSGVFGSAHTGVFNAAMCDGSVRSVSFDIDARIHFLLAAKADRQVVSLD